MPAAANFLRMRARRASSKENTGSGRDASSARNVAQVDESSRRHHHLMGTSPSVVIDGTPLAADLQHVSVIVPTRDRPEFARRAVLSALGQLGVVVDLVVVVDDGGTEPLSDQLGLADPRILIVRHEQSRGVSAARNRGIAESTSPWIAFLDDDDIWMSDKLRRQIDAAVAGGNRWCISGSLVYDSNEMLAEVRGCPPDTSAVLVGLCSHNAVPGGGSGVIVARSLLEDVGGFDESLSMVADWELWHRFAHSAGCAIVSDSLVGYLQHSRSMTATFADHEAEIVRLEQANLFSPMPDGTPTGSPSLQPCE